MHCREIIGAEGSLTTRSAHSTPAGRRSMFSPASVVGTMPSSSGRDGGDAPYADGRESEDRTEWRAHARAAALAGDRGSMRASASGAHSPPPAQERPARDAAGGGRRGGAEAALREVQMSRMADRIEELEHAAADADRRREARAAERFARIAGEIAQATELVQQLQLHIFPKFAQAGGDARAAGGDGAGPGRDELVFGGGSARGEQHASSEVERLNRSLVMLRMIVDAKLETVHTLRAQMQKEAQDATFVMREERQAAAEAREALAKLEASTWQEREALRLDVDSLKGMYEEELGRFRSRIDDAEAAAAASEAKLSATEQHVQRLSEMFDEEQRQREGVERQLMAEQQAHHDSIVSVRMLEQENAGLKAELGSLRRALGAAHDAEAPPSAGAAASPGR